MLYRIKNKEKFYAKWSRFLEGDFESEIVYNLDNGVEVSLRIPIFKVIFGNQIEVFDKEGNEFVLNPHDELFPNFGDGYSKGLEFFNSNYNIDLLYINPELFAKQLDEIYNNGTYLKRLPPKTLREFRPSTLSNKQMFYFGYIHAVYNRIKDIRNNHRVAFKSIQNVKKFEKNPFNNERGLEAFKFISQKWTYDKDLRWAYIYHGFTQEFDIGMRKSDYESFIRETQGFTKAFNFDNATSSNRLESVLDLLDQFEKL